eukprot:TRINITY_DN62379_c0_g1_i1.p1 TRINITY_DN62379_c0_g1~~TRINITY_DN62379_c0_g1_i1.p1  ORF type:complete len:486 (-),score=86.07 TRINITY_DN62379_c0_g1_i1:136-1443(-)
MPDSSDIDGRSKKIPSRAAETNGEVGIAARIKEDVDEACIIRPPISDAVFVELGDRLRAGHLVSFPTETVYGLGANGLDAQAVLKIFEAKGRPLSDPCILHVNGADEALRWLDLNTREAEIFKFLADACWPGPLSIVGRAGPSVPAEVTSGTGFAAMRCPAHPVARRLIEAAGVPLAAPSANRFGHISPTQPEHVLEDLRHWNGLRILDGGACNVGIESTVLKLDIDNGRVNILRRGGVTRERLQAILEQGGFGESLSVEVVESTKPSVQAADVTAQAQESPGMMLKHYAPAVPTVLVRCCSAGENAVGEELPFEPQRSVLIDFRGQLAHLRPLFLQAFDLCAQLPEGSLRLESKASIDEACARAFAVLREAEGFALSQKACLICIPDFDASKLGGLAEALYDRLFRAASGRRANLIEPEGEGQILRLIGTMDTN